MRRSTDMPMRRLARRLALFSGAAVVVIAALVIALISNARSSAASNSAKHAATVAQSAANDAKDTANCVNTALGQRSGPLRKDQVAQVAFADAVDSILSLSPKAPPAVQLAAVAKFRAEVAQYKATLDADEVERLAHPLGKC